jgi:hypothetical protein
VWVSQRRVLLTTFFCGDREQLRFPIDGCNRKRPERNQIDTGHELGQERWQKLPVPAEKVNQQGCDAEIHDF